MADQLTGVPMPPINVDVDYSMVLVEMDGITEEEAMRIASTQGVPVLRTGDRVPFVPESDEGPRRGQFEFFGKVRQVTLSFVALSQGSLTEAQSEEVVRTAKLFPHGTVVHGIDRHGIWTVIADQDGVTKEYNPLCFLD